jgi:hypothetical protein
VLAGIDVRRAALVAGGEVVDAWGDWPDGRLAARPAGGDAPPLDDLDVTSGHLLAEQETPAVVGLDSPAGPVVLPATWDGAAAQASLPAALFDLSGAPASGPVAVTVERMRGYDMEGKTGALVRGDGTVSRRGDTCVVTVAASRVVGWRGLDTEAAAVADATRG